MKATIKKFREWATEHSDTKINKSLRELAKIFKICTFSVRMIAKEFNIKTKGRVIMQICSKGHDLSVVGRINRMCAKCLKDYKKEYVKKNKEKKKEYDKKRRLQNKEKINIQARQYYENNKDQILQIHRKWKAEHKEEILIQTKKYVAKKLKTDPLFKLAVLLRSRLYDALKKNSKVGSAVNDLGCTLEFFKDYIEKKFYGKMTWNNWGTYWQLDHKKALFLFDLIDPKQFKQAAHYTNYQPLTIPDHKKKTIEDLRKGKKK